MRQSAEAIARNRERARNYQRNKTSKQRVEDGIRRNLNRRFVCWDGEGENYFIASPDGICERHRYILFGSSAGDIITGPGLSTKECLDLILTAETRDPNCWHTWFSAEYDVNMILSDLSWRHLYILKEYGKVRWNGYRITHTPRKTFGVSRDGVSATIYDVFGFFHTSYLTALEKFEIGTEAQLARIREGKDKRNQFTYGMLQYIIDYWRDELGLMPDLMDTIRTLCYDAGLCITAWHGPGALAAYMLKVNNIRSYMSDENNVPVEVKLARMYAFAGGWFMSWRCGLWEGPTYQYDVNSAYLYAASLMPRLDNGRWERRTPNEIPPNCPLFGLYRIRYAGVYSEDRASDQQIYPLFHRDKMGELTWPERTEGWFWGPEARLVLGTPEAELLEAWVFVDDGSKPFEIVNEYFHRRQVLKAAGNPAQKTIKWGLAAWYGQFARRVGWDKKLKLAPRSHQLEWAGFITSYCRSMVYRAASYAADHNGLVSVDTDGVTCTVPIPSEVLENGYGDELGQWSVDTYSGILFWQNGVYWLRDDEGWKSAKARGVPRGRIDPEIAFATYSRIRTPWRPGPKPDISEAGVIDIDRIRFVGYRQTLTTRAYSDWRTWQPQPARLIMGGAGKSLHIPIKCQECKRPTGGMHSVTQPTIKPGMSADAVQKAASRDIPMSYPHQLPWLVDIPNFDSVPEEYTEDIIPDGWERDDL